MVQGLKDTETFRRNTRMYHHSQHCWQMPRWNIS